ncbi:MAG: hypothetical protein ACFCUJ_15480 [Thiotrichales bacterium]
MFENRQRLEIRLQPGVLSGIVAIILAILGILTIGVVFTPLAALTTIAGFVVSISRLSVSGIGLNILATMLTTAAFISSPVLVLTVVTLFGNLEKAISSSLIGHTEYSAGPEGSGSAYQIDQPAFDSKHKLASEESGDDYSHAVPQETNGVKQYPVDKDYASYCNPRFRFCINYPSDMGMLPPPENDDGREFFYRDGFRFVVSGINNIDDTTPTEAYNQSRGLFDTVTYKKLGTNWFVVSGLKNGNVLYVKEFVTPESMRSIYIEYPESRKHEYHEVVNILSRSFRLY